MSYAHRRADERARFATAIAVVLVFAIGGCNGSSKRDQSYGTDAGANYEGPPRVTTYNDAGTDADTDTDATAAEGDAAVAAQDAEADVGGAVD